MKTQSALNSIRRPGDEMSIHHLQRIHRTLTIGYGVADSVPECRDVMLNTWQGRTVEGHPVHLVFHGGELTIEVDLPTASGGSKPLTVMRWNPLHAIPSLKRLVARKDGHGPYDHTALPVSGMSLPVIEPNAQSAEIRAFHARLDGILDEARLTEWLVLHNKHFDLLTSLGLAGSRIRFRTDAWPSQSIAA